MTDDHLTDQDIQRLLATVDREDSLGHPQRAELRQAVLAEYRSLVERPLPGPGEARVTELDVIGLDTTGLGTTSLDVDGGPIPLAAAPSANRSLPVLAGVAAVLLVAVLSATWLRGDANQAVETSSVPELTAADDTDGPAAVDPGAYRLGHVAGGVELTVASDDISVTGIGPDHIELRPVDDGWGSSLVIMTAEGSLTDLVESYRDQGLITVLRSVAGSADGLVTEFEIRPTNSARADECRLDDGCATLGDTQLDLDGVNFARQIDGPGRAAVWVLYRSDTAYAPFQRTANAIVESITFPSDR